MMTAQAVSDQSAIQHGTYAGAQWHVRNSVPTCQPCRDARAEYQKAWRQRNPEGRQRERDVTAANSRALWRLADLHPLQFRALFQEEIRKGRGR